MSFFDALISSGTKSAKILKNINPYNIYPNPNQPRKHFDKDSIACLAESIKMYGLLQPITVRALSKGKYELIAGERRLRAAVYAGIPTVPCIVTDICKQESAELAVIENIQRENLNIFEQAFAIDKLLKNSSYTQNQLAEKLSMSQSALANKLRLLRFNEEQRNLILLYGLGERTSRAFLRLPPEKRSECIVYAAEKNLNSVQTEEYIDDIICKSAVSGVFCEQEKRAGHKKRPEKTKLFSGKKTYVLKDLSLFYNTIKNSLEILQKAGFKTEFKKNEGKNRVDITISLEK